MSNAETDALFLKNSRKYPKPTWMGLRLVPIASISIGHGLFGGNTTRESRCMYIYGLIHTNGMLKVFMSSAFFLKI